MGQSLCSEIDFLYLCTLWVLKTNRIMKAEDNKTGKSVLKGFAGKKEINRIECYCKNIRHSFIGIKNISFIVELASSHEIIKYNAKSGQ